MPDDKPIPIREISEKHAISDSSPIYRYMSIAEFMAMAESKSLTLRKIAEWEDPNEAYCLRRTIEFLKEHYRKRGKSQDEEFKAFEKNITDRAFGICLTKNYESDSLWRIFSSFKTGVQIETTVAKLKNAIEKAKFGGMYIIGKISYEILKPASIEGNDLDAISLEVFLIKDTPFEHENEVRLVFMTRENHDGSTDGPKNIPMESSYISKIKIDPRAEKWFVDAIKSYCQRTDWLSDIPTEQSSLYEKCEERVKKATD